MDKKAFMDECVIAIMKELVRDELRSAEAAYLEVGVIANKAFEIADAMYSSYLARVKPDVAPVPAAEPAPSTAGGCSSADAFNHMLTTEFCKMYDLPEFARHALNNHVKMSNAWANINPHTLVFQIALQPGVLSEIELRKFNLWLLKKWRRLCGGTSALAGIDALEQFISGELSADELDKCRASMENAKPERVGAVSLDMTYAVKRAVYPWTNSITCVPGSVKDSIASVLRALAAIDNDLADSEVAHMAAWLRENTRPMFPPDPRRLLTDPLDKRKK